MKRSLAAALAALLCAALLAGCAQTGTDAPAAEPENKPAQTEPAQTEPAPAAENEPAQTAPAPAEPEQPKALTYHIEHTDLHEDLPVSMYFDIPVFEGDSEAARKINAELAAVRQTYIDTEAAGVLESVRDSMDDEYGPTEERPYYNEHAANVPTCDESLVSVTIGYNWFMGGVADYGVDTYNYNAKTGERLYLNDLTDGTEEEIKEAIVAALLEQYPGVEEAGVMDTPMDAIRGKDLREFHFYVEDGAIHVAFNKYEITYGAAGAFDVVLPNALKSIG